MTKSGFSSISPWTNRLEDGTQVLGVDWAHNGIGFGRWEMIINKDGTVSLCTECMDTNEDKEFSKQLMLALIDMATVEE